MAESNASVTVDTPHPGVAVVTYDNPSIGNHLSWEGAGRLAAGVAEAKQRDATVVVLASAVPGRWIEHAWLTDLVALGSGQPQSGDGVDVFRLVKAVSDPAVVVIAAIDGSTSGGGCEIGWACDLRVAGADATFGQIEVQLGLSPGLGGASRLLRLVGPTAAAELVFDGRSVSATRMAELGAVNRVVPVGTARDAAVEWARLMASRPAAGLRASKQILREAEDRSLHDALRNEQTIFQTTVAAALDDLAVVQARIDAGEALTDIYGSADD